MKKTQWNKADIVSNVFQPTRLPLSKLAFVFATLCASVISGNALAQELSIPCDEVEKKALEEAKENEVTRITAFQPAMPIERANPRYPAQAARKGQEGWVRMSYVVDEEGRVKDPVVDDFFGNSAFKKSALSAVKKWKFEPAVKDGEPTQQCHQSVQMDFVLGGRTGASRKFVGAYKDADALFQAGDIDAAEAALSELKDWDTLNRYENTWLLNLDSQIANKLGDVEREAQSIGRILSSNGSKRDKNMVFDENYVAYSLQRKIILDSQRGLFADALSSFSKLKEMDDQQTRIEEITPIIEQIETAIASNQNLEVPVTIGENGNWFHTLVRSQFAFNDINGDLDTVEVRCESHREKFTVAEGHVWKIPESWGQCRVLVKGDDATKFNLIEVAQS